jgi:hypothetical protein
MTPLADGARARSDERPVTAPAARPVTAPAARLTSAT